MPSSPGSIPPLTRRGHGQYVHPVPRRCCRHQEVGVQLELVVGAPSLGHHLGGPHPPLHVLPGELRAERRDHTLRGAHALDLHVAAKPWGGGRWGGAGERGREKEGWESEGGRGGEASGGKGDEGCGRKGRERDGGGREGGRQSHEQV